MTETGSTDAAAKGTGIKSSHESADQHSADRQTFHFERTFCHWITQSTENGSSYVKVEPKTPESVTYYKYKWDDGWMSIPYNHFCSAMKLRDWVAINNLFKRWRVKSMGFKMDHIISTSTELGSTGGAIQENTTFNEQPYMWTYIDTEYQLPPQTDIAETLPNENMKIPWMKSNRTGMALKNYIGHWISSYGVSDAEALRALVNPLQTNLIGSIKSGETFGYQWHASEKDLQFWRHASQPFASDGMLIGEKGTMYYDTGADYKASIMGTMDYSNTIDGNYHYQTDIRQTWHKPPPSSIIKVLPLYNKDAGLVNLSFFVQCTYNVTIEGQFNQILYYPLLWDSSSQHFTQDCASGVNNIKLTMGPHLPGDTVIPESKRKKRQACDPPTDTEAATNIKLLTEEVTKLKQDLSESATELANQRNYLASANAQLRLKERTIESLHKRLQGCTTLPKDQPTEEET